MSTYGAKRTRFFRRRTALAVGGALGAFFVATTAGAQSDINPPLPNVMLLVDTSGSMEFQANGSNVTCNPGNTALTNDRSRWVNVLEVLTGTFSDYSCQAVDRASDNYKQSEYQLITNTAPYDYRYTIPYHRPLTGGSTGCVAAPGSMPGASSTNPFIYPTDPIHYHQFTANYSGTAPACTQAQTNDGILDAFGTRVRFGLMTFDTEINAGTGFSGTAADPATGQAGLYSYVIGSAVQGAPMGCVTTTAQEVGARNGSAPAWEGRMINFGNPNDAERAYITQAQRIQQVLVATRPFGATPIAGMLHDAEDFFWKDDMIDPGVVPAGAPTPFNEYGPMHDPFVQCDTPRQQVIILLTDGEPNMDLRPQCLETPSGDLAAGTCPFDLPEEIANRLAHPTAASTGRKPIKTYVVGFGIEMVDADFSSATPLVSCTAVTTAQCADSRVPTNLPLQACCNLRNIAIAGDGQALFASNAEQLRSAISEILRRVVPTTSRTQPASSGGGSASGGGMLRFFSGFEVGQLAPWSAQLTRERWKCEALSTGGPKVPNKQAFNPNDGDDFVANVNGHKDERRFYTVVAKNSSNVVQSGVETVRKFIPSTDPDGAGTLTPVFHNRLDAATYAANVQSPALAIPVASRPTGLTDPQAATFFLKWLTGANPTTDTYHRCRNSSNCELIGDIYHSTPQVIGAPAERLQDESYQAFATGLAKRPVVLYTLTNDGFLHAFKVASNDPADTSLADQVLSNGKSNELWAFAPPAALAGVYNLYPYNHMHLLDGVATIADVVAVAPSSGTPVVFERNAADAQAGRGAWRTILVQGFGLGRGGYFAVDVTNPVPDPSSPNDPEKGGPRFLWQLTRDASGNELFGRAGANPTITTLFYDPDGISGPREIPVAILPGGHGGTPRASTTGCPEAPAPSRTFTNIDPSFPPRGRVKCYDWGSGNSEIGARSLTIVRLDTGEIVRTFRQKQTEVASTTLRARVTEVDIDSPITGQPVAFPGIAGAVADRIIVGDEDGRLWRVNLASTKPSDWTMKLFLDLYPTSIGSTVTTNTFSNGQPIATAPILSVDDLGNMTVNVATGDQDALGFSTNMKNYVYSIVEDFNGVRTTLATSKVKWFKEFASGERAVGPLVLFNKNVYFSTFAANNSATAATACKPGTSKLWGMNYILPVGAATSGQGGIHSPLAGTTDSNQAITRDDTVIFGVTLAQQQTCFTRVDDDIGNDLFGYKGQTVVSQVTPAKFELVVQESQSGAAAGQAPVAETIPLEPPSSYARVMSWASILE